MRSDASIPWIWVVTDSQLCTNLPPTAETSPSGLADMAQRSYPGPRPPVDPAEAHGEPHGVHVAPEGSSDAYETHSLSHWATFLVSPLVYTRMSVPIPLIINRTLHDSFRAALGDDLDTFFDQPIIAVRLALLTRSVDLLPPHHPRHSTLYSR